MLCSAIIFATGLSTRGAKGPLSECWIGAPKLHALNQSQVDLVAQWQAHVTRKDDSVTKRTCHLFVKNIFRFLILESLSGNFSHSTYGIFLCALQNLMLQFWLWINAFYQKGPLIDIMIGRSVCNLKLV